MYLVDSIKSDLLKDCRFIFQHGITWGTLYIPERDIYNVTQAGLKTCNPLALTFPAVAIIGLCHNDW